MSNISVDLLIGMETMREFLETSTIHGLSYISTSKVRSLIFLKCILGSDCGNLPNMQDHIECSMQPFLTVSNGL